MNITKIKNYLLDLIFPINCLGCGQDNFYLCPDCLAKIKPVDYFVCPICRLPSEHGLTCPNCRHKTSLDGLIFAANYEQPLLQKAIGKMKYQLIKDLIGPLSQILINVLVPSSFISCFLVDLVVPVPLHRRKIAERGFNQSELIAKIIGEKFNWPVETESIIRFKSTKNQASLSKEKRLKNVINAFRVVGAHKLKDKNIVLIDDVCTTGATLEEVAKLLKTNGAKKVFALTLARGKF
ncbi:MAG: ComF family protein [Patescibacteria group bacterium]|nr:ComF family protein [Patescibacteria group bacterium]MDD5121185.1 ComF family protein [Patescibacteria group bacterium]MDD5221997.1 ComF family protein [Patescibacteria group bacterium]MDD5395896.1 ComF family protein [Patescibacteria group bacterium]